MLILRYNSKSQTTSEQLQCNVAYYVCHIGLTIAVQAVRYNMPIAMISKTNTVNLAGKTTKDGPKSLITLLMIMHFMTITYRTTLCLKKFPTLNSL